jgi:hypothetical protein
MRHVIALLLLVALVLAFPPAANAYCRTTTAPVPAGYDPTVNGCITEGVPLVWTSMPVTYELNQAASSQVSLAAATPIVDAAFAKWSAASCITATGATAPPALSFQRQAPTDDAFVACHATADVDAQTCELAQAAGPHQIIFRDDGWPYEDSMNQVALTTVTFGATLGDIRSANTEINSYAYTISTVDPAPDGQYSLAAIMDHEAGHFIGLAHTPVTTAVMYAFYALNQPVSLALQPDDISAVCAIYPPGSGVGSSHACAWSNGGARDPFGLAMTVLGITVAIAAASRRTKRGPLHRPVVAVTYPSAPTPSRY